jgi:hypothetical protein
MKTASTSDPISFRAGHVPAVGDYYLLRHVDDENDEKDGKDGEKEDEIGIVTNADEDEIEISIPEGEHGCSYRRYTFDELKEKTEYLPDGEKDIRQRIDRLANEMTNVEVDTTGLGMALTNYTPHIGENGEGISEKALAPIIQDLTSTRKKIASSRNAVAQVQLKIKQKRAQINHYVLLQRARIEAILKQQAAELEAKLGNLKNLVGKAEEAIWTLNLYLGKDEQIVQIKKGKSAPKDTKITVRQRVLYADEECALADDEGGIDASSIKEFDEWLKIPANRQQVFPEAKGVIAFKPRRKKKKYESETALDMWSAAKEDVKNKKTYFLIANGENLYRICTELEVSERLIPVEDEYSELFFRMEYNSTTREYEKEPIYPGDAKYMRCLEQADEIKRHYLRILLFLQGLLDRTAVLAPLPAPRLNLLNRQVYLDHLTFITDGEKLLGDGRPSFKDWLQTINSKLDIGHRVMGTFTSWDSEFRSHGEHGRNDRLSPHGAESPDDATLYTVLGTHERGWFFRYKRTETIYRSGYGRGWKRREHGPAKRQASCAISPNDSFILNFDDAEVPDMLFYLGDRTNRQHYAVMHPILKKAIQLKDLEAKEEKPFRELLVNHITKEIKLCWKKRE